MKKVLFVFVAVISMLTMTSCVDKEQCVGKWESENVSEEGFTGNFYLDLNENGTANLRIKGTGAVEEEGMDMKIGITANLHKILRILHQFDEKVETTAHFLSESKC